MKDKYKKIKKIFEQFGIQFSIKYFYYKFFHKDEKYIELVYNYLLNCISPLIEKYKNITEEKKYNNNKYVPVWVCWWQGYEKMPELCKMFYKRLENMLPDNSKLILITLDNYLEYAKIPPLLIDKFQKGIISMTTFSDILRNYLLRDNGGLWIDSSVFVSKKISKEFLEKKEWWSINLYNKNEKIINLGQKISSRRWSGFLQKGEKNNLLNSFICDAFILYYEKHDITIDYFIQNFLIKIAYDKILKIHEMIDKIPTSNKHVYSLYDNIDSKFDKYVYKEWNNTTTFYKLTQKRNYNITTPENRITYFGAIKEICEKGGTLKYEEK